MSKKARTPRNFRDVNGILLLDKPAGLSSNKALQKVRYLFKGKKAGHAGSLDPLATGLLPICFGEATKFSTFLLDASKRYRAICQLGVSSTTGDEEGELSDKIDVTVSKNDVIEALQQFLGKTQQIPPMHSALKQNGVRLYELARKGEVVDRPPRDIEIYDIELIDFDEEKDQITIDVHSSKGTYIRTLVEDIAISLGTKAYILQLDRTGVHPFWGMPTFTFDDLDILDEAKKLDTSLLPIDTAVSDWAAVYLDENASYYLKLGQPIQVPNAPAEGFVRFFDENKKFLGVGEVKSDGNLAPKRMMRTET